VEQGESHVISHCIVSVFCSFFTLWLLCIEHINSELTCCESRGGDVWSGESLVMPFDSYV